MLGDDAVAGQPAAVVTEVLTGGADEERPGAEDGHPEADVAGDASSTDLEAVGEETDRDLVELLDDQGVGEPPAEGHEVVGGDGPGDGDLHQSNLPAPGHGNGPGPSRGWPGPVGTVGQLKLSPQAQELPALGLSIVNPCFSMVSEKSMVAPSR